MKKNAFSLVELAIVLTIVGVVVGGSFKGAKMMREKSRTIESKEYVRAAKEAVVGYTFEFPELPTVSNFDQNLTPVTGTQIKLLYYPDTNLSQLSDVCAFSSTNLSVVDNARSPARTINNVAFVVASAGANANMQTKVDTSVSPNVVNIYSPSTKVDDNTTSGYIDRASDEYDDIVSWMTLAELQSEVGCNDNPMKFINSRLPDAKEGVSYSATLYVENNITGITISCNSSNAHGISFSSPNFSSAPDSNGTAHFTCKATEDAPSSREVEKEYVITIDPADTNSSGSGSGTGFPGSGSGVGI